MAIARRKVDALIIGGGIIGLAIGYYLAKMNFCNVEIVERDFDLTTHASGHNAGGLASAHDSHPPEERPLFLESARLYRELSKSFDFDYVRAGTIIPGTKDDEQNFEKTVNKYSDANEGIRLDFLDGAELQEKEPYLSRNRFNCGIFYPMDAQGNSKKLGECFAQACLKSGIRISTGAKLTGIEVSQGRTTEARIDNGELVSPGMVIVAAGPWSGEVSKMLGINIPVSPVKGHLISLETKGRKLVNSFVSGPKFYVVQNGSNVVIGGGEDSVGFDVSIDDNTIRDEWTEGVSMVPELDSLNDETMSKTACLRPYAADGLPIIGKSTIISNVYFATGHYRTGFALAPVTGKLISQLVVDGETEFDLSAFSPDRFL